MTEKSNEQLERELAGLDKRLAQAKDKYYALSREYDKIAAEGRDKLCALKSAKEWHTLKILGAVALFMARLVIGQSVSALF